MDTRLAFLLKNNEVKENNFFFQWIHIFHDLWRERGSFEAMAPVEN